VAHIASGLVGLLSLTCVRNFFTFTHSNDLSARASQRVLAGMVDPIGWLDMDMFFKGGKSPDGGSFRAAHPGWAARRRSLAL